MSQNDLDTKQQKINQNEYSAKHITVLEGLEPVRKRPGMYIGGTGIAGLHHLIWEVADNSIDEAMAGFATKVIITLLPGNRMAVVDDGRGIPVDIHKQTGKSALETVLSTLHAGGKFGDGGYKVSGGLHGVGVSVVNALSTWLVAIVNREGKLYFQQYSKGSPKEAVKEVLLDSVPDDLKKLAGVLKSYNSGTLIAFEPDQSIFADRTFSLQTIIDHLRQQAYLNKKLFLTIYDLRDLENIENQSSYTFFFEGGVSSYVRHLNRNKQVLNDPPIYIEKTQNDVTVEVALAYNATDYNERVFTFANTIHTIDGGTHLTGFKSALTRVTNEYAKKQNLIKPGQVLSGEDIREGLTAVISIKLREPQFEGQTKGKLGNPEAKTIVEQITGEGLNYYFEEHPQEAKRIIQRCCLSLQARLAAKAARETVIRKGVLEGMTLPGKLADCSDRDPSHSELYIVEGDSAGGSAKQGRDRKFQAILPLRGKILNVEKARMDRMLTSDEIKNLIIALGCGIGDEINVEKARYHRIIIMTDADVDGSHIRTLLLTLFYRHFPELIRNGYIYIAQPPLYAITKGKEKLYAYNDEEKENILAGLRANLAKSKSKISEIVADNENASETVTEDELENTSSKSKTMGYNIQRYKGLGEMNPTQLWETTMDPQSRVLLQVTINEAERADEIFSMLMGDEVGPRKKFIQTHAKSVKNLDV